MEKINIKEYHNTKDFFNLSKSIDKILKNDYFIFIF